MTPPETAADPRIVEGSNGMLLEIDGQILPNYDATIVPFDEGDVVTGKVVRIDKDEVLIDIGYKSEGVIPNNELSIRKSVDPSEEVELGEEVDALVLTKEDQDGRLILSKKRARFERAWRRIEAAAESGEPVIGAVIEVVKGGLIIDLGVRGFLPASLVDIRRVPNLDEYLGQNIQCKVIELNRSRNNVVLSRRAVLEEERKEQRQAILERLQPGLIIEGQISNIVDFGAFVDLDGIDGLIHISELSWSHVNHPSEILNIGDTVQVKVLDIDRDRQRISLGLKQTQEDPVAARRRHLQRRRRARGRGHQGRRLRRLRRDPRGRRGARAHLRARPAARREPARDRPARRRSEGQDPRDRLRAAPPLALDQARRGPGAPAPRGRATRRPAMRATWTTCRSSACPRTSSPTRRRPPPEAPATSRWPRPRPRAAARSQAAGRGGLRRGAREERAGRAEAVRRGARRRRARRATLPTRGRAELSTPPFVGLTGGIGAGKSEALAALGRLGAATLSTDAVVHELYADPEVRDAVVGRWGEEIAPDGVVDRGAVAARRSPPTASASSSRG